MGYVCIVRSILQDPNENANACINVQNSPNDILAAAVTASVVVAVEIAVVVRVVAAVTAVFTKGKRDVVVVSNDELKEKYEKNITELKLEFDQRFEDLKKEMYEGAYLRENHPDKIKFRDLRNIEN